MSFIPHLNKYRRKPPRSKKTAAETMLTDHEMSRFVAFSCRFRSCSDHRIARHGLRMLDEERHAQGSVRVDVASTIDVDDEATILN